MSSGTPVYKGKVTHRSWPQLPEELLRHIATFYLWDISAKNYCPNTWDTRENWHHRMVYTTLRDANDVEKHMMSICPQWHAALSTHLFWQQAIALIDPCDVLAHHAVVHPKNGALSSSAASVRLTPYRHFRNITSCSCYVCRINSPTTSIGLTNAKRFLHTTHLRTIALCREHDRRPASFCGLCLRTAPIYEHVLVGAQVQAAAAAQENMIGIVDNDDKDSFPNVEATCRTCRIEWLWKRALENPKDREAIGGRNLASEDWETRNAVDSFLDLAEGNIKDVLLMAREKLWLRKNTRLNDMLLQALAASRFNNGGRVYDGDEQEEEEDDEDEDEDDIELMQMEESGVRDLALGDWARGRILDGHWISPADVWYNHTVPGKPTHVPAVHPCPWTRDASSFGSSPAADEEDVHPRPSTLSAEIPPTYGLCEQAFIAHQRQMRVALIVAMRNLVRKIVIECQTPELGQGVEDPAIRAAKMTIEDVLRELREEEGLWFEGFDWVERRMNDRRERENRDRDAIGSNTTGSDDSSASSSGSRSSNGTSPVLSATTLQTTPSPPPIPLGELKKEEGDEPSSEASPSAAQASTSPSSVPVMISVSPVLDPPKLLRPIPYIPETSSHFPPVVPTQAPPPASDQPPIRIRSSVPPATVKLTEVIDVDGEGEEEVELLEIEEEEVYEEEEDEEDMEQVGETDGYEELESASEEDDIDIPRPRKRSSDELTGDETLSSEDGGRDRGGTPPKRARTTSEQEDLTSSPMRKRSSEELEEAGEESVSKKMKVSSVASLGEVGGEGEPLTPPPTSGSEFSISSRPSSVFMA
ncbi:ABC domain-containing protein [Lyophyllum atratum]|nr:ABC domain-containing protein [Lyophyllum atratum]